MCLVDVLQWEYQVGPCVGIDGGDQMWVSRYLLYRICGEWQACGLSVGADLLPFLLGSVVALQQGSCRAPALQRLLRHSILAGIAQVFVALAAAHD
jgi:hypothetical protein